MTLVSPCLHQQNLRDFDNQDFTQAFGLETQPLLPPPSGGRVKTAITLTRKRSGTGQLRPYGTKDEGALFLVDLLSAGLHYPASLDES